MDATEALDEIAFRLETERAPQFKVQAFRKASATVGAWSTDELRARAADGRLKATKGIGASTLEVILQALDGGIPDRLAKLRSAETSPLTESGRELRPQIRGDLHAHSDWSDGTTPIPQMVAAAISLGREYLALTDHSPNLTVAHGLTAERLEQQLAEIEGLREVLESRGAGLRLLTGIEVDILDDGTLDQRPELLGRLDIVVASIHSHLRADARTMTERMLGAITDERTTILGHCTGRLVEGSRGTRPPSEFDAERIFAACAENDVAVEINARPERQDPPDELIALALEAGCLFSIDSDAHAPGQLALLDYGIERAALCGVPAERIITTWPVERLLDWAH
ncbi:PHP domain-containing protein [Subtercola sp. Z020]|uniref:PHP domain-containing protein n=1 Tax=Subtercola sp. Z020 TaxID=2080582 RepID=UPI000CE759B8|nr:PHP domain-containing protein [Subtercola sp. Z020]PPF78313.1 PHP domain-containing protein [Subtercola sp. Z020]